MEKALSYIAFTFVAMAILYVVYQQNNKDNPMQDIKILLSPFRAILENTKSIEFTSSALDMEQYYRSQFILAPTIITSTVTCDTILTIEKTNVQTTFFPSKTIARNEYNGFTAVLSTR